MTRFAHLALAAACVAAMVGFATPGEARHLRHDNRCHWVYHRHWGPGFHHHDRWLRSPFRDSFHGWRYRQLSPREVKAALRWQGYHAVRRLGYRRGVYRALAHGRHGHLRRLYVHPVSGRVLCTSPVRRHAHRHRDFEGPRHDPGFPWRSESRRHDRNDRQRDRDRYRP